ncbi:sensor histidine kinase NtrY-like [Sphingomonas xinjiangensis]|uniref:histidine kinase n=1 Tax=Sphingomonas xinjiangensis TaxID=643568 RepID=A0A840Y8P7_9SPHN|nr:ATP-binding protein [Sphingomonas xinjiangensis]MBB5709224.1 two-component system nitrogen regulation sensor histidine kinase NtrY [Sphingomonas xinjiangensis]
MDVASKQTADLRPRERRLVVTPTIEFLVLAVAVIAAVATYLVVTRQGTPQRLLTPPLVATLLVANLITCGSLIVLVGRRVALRRAARLPGGGRAQLHLRLVAIFSVLAAVPTVLLAVVASILFQFVAEFWFTGRAQGLLENSRGLAEESYAQLLQYVDNENIALARDVNRALNSGYVIDTPEFKASFSWTVFQRSLSSSLLFSLSSKGEIQTQALVNNSDRNLMLDVSPADVRKLSEGKLSVVGTNPKFTYSLTRVPETDLYLYSYREPYANEMAVRLGRVKSVFTDYNALLSRSRAIQLRFNIVLFVISLIIIALVVFFAITAADRLVRPINELVDAARRVAEGNLGARVAVAKNADEIATLGSAFNGMTERLQAQTEALVSANAQAESRRVLIEAVISGVSAGVVAIDADRGIRLMNASARSLLGRGEEDPVGRSLRDVVPELDALLDGEEREAVVQISKGSDARTLAVKVTSDEQGRVLTFDDITQQLNDQRRAAWSDVARRIAHEIKNPLTPIQLAAERLQRRYGKQIDPADPTFSKLTETIVRQVGDLRRMVDEFSSFARMPKPVFREESLLDIARQAMFLHEVAHPGIRFLLDEPGEAPSIVCDRRQIGQALTNIVKNAVEAIDTRLEKGEGGTGEVVLTLHPKADHRVLLTVSDNGVGLPADRDRIIEPYMTTRSRGTGLGLAIVTKIVEEHFGTIAFTDRTGGGTVVTLCFDTEMLDRVTTAPDDGGDARPTAVISSGSRRS